MRKIIIIYSLIFAGYMPVMADVLSVEGWTNGTTQGWSCWDTINETMVTGIAASQGYLDVTFAGLSMKMPPVEYMFKADKNASSGSFAGNYFSNGVQYLSFKVYCEYGSAVCAIIYGNGQFWRYQVPAVATGTWVQVNVPVSPSVLRNLCATNNLEEFSQTLTAVEWIGVTFLRNKTLNAYHCRVDDVTLVGAGTGYGDWIGKYAANGGDKLPDGDLNGDGVNNLSAWIAGTDPTDKNSVFKLKSVSAKPNGDGGFTLEWHSVKGREYQVWRTDNLISGFSSISDWIPAEPPLNTYTDESTIGSGPYFYKLKVRKVE